MEKLLYASIQREYDYIYDLCMQSTLIAIDFGTLTDKKTLFSAISCAIEQKNRGRLSTIPGPGFKVLKVDLKPHTLKALSFQTLLCMQDLLYASKQRKNGDIYDPRFESTLIAIDFGTFLEQEELLFAISCAIENKKS